MFWKTLWFSSNNMTLDCIRGASLRVEKNEAELDQELTLTLPTPITEWSTGQPLCSGMQQKGTRLRFVFLKPVASESSWGRGAYYICRVLDPAPHQWDERLRELGPESSCLRSCSGDSMPRRFWGPGPTLGKTCQWRQNPRGDQRNEGWTHVGMLRLLSYKDLAGSSWPNYSKVTQWH